MDLMDSDFFLNQLQHALGLEGVSVHRGKRNGEEEKQKEKEAGAESNARGKDGTTTIGVCVLAILWKLDTLAQFVGKGTRICSHDTPNMSHLNPKKWQMFGHLQNRGTRRKFTIGSDDKWKNPIGGDDKWRRDSWRDKRGRGGARVSCGVSLPWGGRGRHAYLGVDGGKGGGSSAKLGGGGEIFGVRATWTPEDASNPGGTCFV
jgi:hypothetical protein